MKAYKLNKSHDYWEQPRVFIESDSGYVWAAATPIEPTQYGVSIRNLKRDGYLYEIDIYKEKWVHPHLLKEIRKDLVLSN